MNKPRLADGLERLIRLEHKLGRSAEQIAEDLREVPRYLMEKFGQEKFKTRLGAKFTEAALSIGDEIVAAEVAEVLNTK